MSSQQVAIIPRQIIQKIESLVYEKHGQKFINLSNYCLDFKQSYVFLGFTAKKTKVILGDVYMYGPNEVKYTKKFGRVMSEMVDKVDNTTVKQFKLVTDGHRYSETIMEIVQ